MCLTKVYYNTYADGAEDITEKEYPCREGRGCSHPEVRRYDRKFPFSKLSDRKDGSHRGLADRQPTPYFSDRTPGSAKSSSKSRHRDSGMYLTGSSTAYDYSDPYGYDTYGYRTTTTSSSSRRKRSSDAPRIVYLDRDDTSSKRSRSASRDIPLDLDEYGSSSRRHHRHHDHRHSSSSSRDRDRDRSDDYARRRADDPAGYTLISDADERRHRRRRSSISGYPDALTASASASDPYAAAGAYLPRRSNSTVVHRSDGSIARPSTATTTKHIRWEDEVRSRREAQNAEIASRAPAYSSSLSGGSSTLVDAALGLPSSSPPKGILKRSGSTGKGNGTGTGTGGGGTRKGKGRDEEEVAALARSLERMELPSTRGRDRSRRLSGTDDWLGLDQSWEYGYDGGRRKRSKLYW
ncbi:hypothetical protein VTJ83DRAFT_2684 [Remersonia thermophila]|uniref:Uncharacterized protein n=1 Tax=Remersonia thermophila TaxID=72144 RepID=A0ABR4DJF0_9PEZI